MIQIQKNNTHRRRVLLITALLVIVISIAAGLYWYIQKTNGDSSKTNAKATQEQIEDGNSTKKATIDSSSPSTKPSPNSDTPAASIDGSVVVSIPYADATRLTVLIDGVVSGNCALNLVKGSQTITMSAAIQSGPSTSTCQGFSYNKLSAGTWMATVSVSTPSSTGSATKSVTVE